MTSLFDLKLVVVAGKGGVGRTTVSAALAKAAAGAGRRVLIAQTDAAERLGRLFGRGEPIGPRIVTVAPGVDAVNMTARESLHEYGLMVLRSETVYRAVFESRAVRGFLSAIPGLESFAMLGKAWWHTTPEGRPHYDLVVLDGPASGHAVLMLRVPQAILDAMPKGPLARDARQMRELMVDPGRARMVLVTLPEMLPVRETSELARTARETLGMPLGPVVVNGMPPERLSRPDVDDVLDRARLPTGDPELDSTLRLAASVRAHRRTAEEMLSQLRKDPGLALVPLPRLPTADLGPPELQDLAAALVDGLATGSS